MAGKNAGNTNKTKGSTGPVRADFVGYVNITLTAEDKQDFDLWYAEQDLVMEAHLDLFDTGYQATIKFDHENDTYSVSISNWNVAAADSGVIYTARGDSIDTALRKAVYVWDRKLSRNLNNGHVKGTRKDAW